MHSFVSAKACTGEKEGWAVLRHRIAFWRSLLQRQPCVMHLCTKNTLLGLLPFLYLQSCDLAATR